MSHTTIMLLAGLALLILLRLTIKDAARATRLFLILWLLVAIGTAVLAGAGVAWVNFLLGVGDRL